MTVQQEDPTAPLRVARGSDALSLRDRAGDRPTCAMHKDELLGLIQQTGGLDPEIEIIAQRAATEPPVVVVARAATEPPAVIISVPASETIQDQRPTCAIDPQALRMLMRPSVYPVFRAASHRWALVIAFAAVAIIALLLAL